MTTTTAAMRDSATMLRRNLRHQVRYPSLIVFALVTPIVLLLLFVYVFGGTMGAGLGGELGGEAGDRVDYLAYIVPAIVMITIAGAALNVAISVATDMTGGIIARFRTMAIARVSVLTGHVVGSLMQTMLIISVVIGVAILLGYRPTAGLLEWVAAAGLVALTTFALIWLSVALGLAASTVEGASNLPMPLIILPFLGSGFVPTESMPSGLRWFAEHQPFTPIMETLRGLLTSAPIGNRGFVAVAWTIGIAVVGYLWSKRLYDRDPRI